MLGGGDIEGLHRGTVAVLNRPEFRKKMRKVLKIKKKKIIII